MNLSDLMNRDKEDRKKKTSYEIFVNELLAKGK